MKHLKQEHRSDANPLLPYFYGQNMFGCHGNQDENHHKTYWTDLTIGNQIDRALSKMGI